MTCSFASIQTILSFTGTHLALFNASFETNPLDGKCDQRAVVSAQPVKVTYDAVSIAKADYSQ